MLNILSSTSSKWGVIMVEFHDREKEIDEITRILSTQPNLITFVYGPINSGKSSLMNEVIKGLSDNYVQLRCFFVDLRAQVVSNVGEFYDVFSVTKSA